MTTATPPTIISEIQGAAKTKTRLRFSSVLMVTIVFLVAVSVLISIGILNRYFNKRVELEFQRKLHAQKGQVEILIKNRLADVQKTLADLSSDNTIRVTLLLKADAQLRERLARYVRPDQGVYPFIRKINNGSILPEIYPGISKAFLSTLFYLLPNGDIFFDGRSILGLSKEELADYFSKVQMVWQDPFSCLNPRMKVYDTLSRPLVNFKGLGRSEIRKKIYDLIRIVGLNENELGHYPHEFSGGGRQRIVIARALISDPSFLIADEPTSSLDVSIQAQILNLLRKLKDSYNLTMLFISHDLAVINFISNRVAVMYSRASARASARSFS